MKANVVDLWNDKIIHSNVFKDGKLEFEENLNKQKILEKNKKYMDDPKLQFLSSSRNLTIEKRKLKKEFLEAVKRNNEYDNNAKTPWFIYNKYNLSSKLKINAKPFNTLQNVELEKNLNGEKQIENNNKVNKKENHQILKTDIDYKQHKLNLKYDNNFYLKQLNPRIAEKLNKKQSIIMTKSNVSNSNSPLKKSNDFENLKKELENLNRPIIKKTEIHFIKKILIILELKILYYLIVHLKQIIF